MVVMHTAPRLYDTFQPDEYRLEIELQDRESRVFRGSVGILGHYVGGKPLTLHAKDLKITLLKSNGEDVTYTQDGDHLILDDSSGPGHRHLTIYFEGRITDAMHGLYPCYFEVNGKKKELLASQFESHHAREVFPCVDEPEAKAIFSLALHTENNVAVLSNMPARTVMPEGDKTITVFPPTPKMSTYLLAFVVGELQKKSATTKGGVEVNLWATHAQSLESLDFGLDVAVRSIDFFNDYFGVPYPLPKCDHVALPDFSSGAMENWGLVTYREVCLLIDDKSAITSKEFAATVIAHETSHQWFGNLVTMKWWDDLWLNESFASLMEYVCVDALFPDWNIWMLFATHESLSALRRDYLPGVQPVRTTVNHPDEIGALFDPSIVYAKGARLLHMLHEYVGDEAFKNGLSHYFNNHAYGNTTGTDLWRAIGNQSGKDVTLFMNAWLEQSGMPIVTMTTRDDVYTLSQHRFVIGASPNGSLWPIPLAAMDPQLPAIMEEQEITAKHSDALPLMNKGNSSHFVTAYDQRAMERLIAAVADGVLPDVDRLALLHETDLVTRAGNVSATSLISLTDAYRHETNESVWDIIALVIGDLKRFVDDAPSPETNFKQWVTTLVTPLYEQVGWEQKDDETSETTKLRTTLVGLLSYADNPDVMNRATAMYHEAHTLTDIPGEIRSLIFSIVTKQADQPAIEHLIKTHNTTHNAELKQDIVLGLTATRDPRLITRLLGFMTDENIVRPQDVDRWFAYMIRSRYARDQAWRWLVANWQWIETTFDGDKSYDSYPRYAASALGTRAWQFTFEAFFIPKRDQPGLTRTIDLGIQDISSKADWLERDQASVLERFTPDRS